LETTVRKLIYDNRTKWFDTELTEEDVESYFTPTVKLFKSGKMYLVRVNASFVKGPQSGSIVLKKTDGIDTMVKIYDENQNDIAAETIDEKTSMITIIEVQGIRCSAKSFQIDIELKQIMILKPVDLFQKCVIKTKTTCDNTLGNSTKETLEEKHEVIPPIVLNVDLEKKEDKEVEEDKDNNNDNDSDTEEEEEKLNPIKIFSDDVLEVNLDTEELNENDTFHLKEKTEVYYEMYREARRKAKLAKSLALSSFMEARRIKNLYMLDDIDDSDSDVDDLEEKDA
jgi:putative transposon-encoded protein